MAIVDSAFHEWIAEFKAINPGFAETRQIIDTAQYAFAAGRKAQRETDAARQPVGPMSSEAYQVVRGMVAHCIEHRLCMGMDEGFASFDPDVEHPFVQELREFVEGSRQPVGEPVAWMTHHDEPMLFPTAAEAAAYCEDDEQPAPLFRSPAQTVDLGAAIKAAFPRLTDYGLHHSHCCEYKLIDERNRLHALIDSRAEVRRG